MRNLMINLILALFWILAFSFHSFAQTSDDLFNGDVLHEVRIYIDPRDYATFKETNFICPLQDLEALAGKRISALPRIECWFPVEFHWMFKAREAAAILSRPLRSNSAGTKVRTIFWG